MQEAEVVPGQVVGQAVGKHGEGRLGRRVDRAVLAQARLCTPAAGVPAGKGLAQ